MDGYKLVTAIGTIVAVLAAGVSIVLGVLNRRSTARKETVDGMMIESARRDKEIERLKSEIESLTKRIAVMEAKEEVLESTISRLEREKVELLDENRRLRKKANRAEGRDSDDA